MSEEGTLNSEAGLSEGWHKSERTPRRRGIRQPSESRLDARSHDLRSDFEQLQANRGALRPREFGALQPEPSQGLH